MLDLAARMDQNGSVSRIIEMLSQTNEILEDMVTKECNQPTSHKTTMRTGLPEVGWKTLYKGVEPSKSLTAQVEDTCGLLEAYSMVDEDLLTVDGNLAAYRLSEARAFVEAMSQDMARSLFYDSSKIHPERPHGLSVRYSTLNSAVPLSANIIDAGGTADEELTSIWLIVWGDQTVHAIYPKGTQAGLQHTDKGKERVTVNKKDLDPSAEEGVLFYYAYIDQFKWRIGFSVPDWRYAVRIVNIPVKRITSIKLIDLMIEAIEKVPSLSLGKGAWYMNRGMRTALRKEIKNVENVHLSLNEVAGKRVLFFDELPVRRVDALLNTESRVA
jgi:hypothetical protein